MASRITTTINTYLRRFFGIQIIMVKKTPKKSQKPKLRSEYMHDPSYSYMHSSNYTTLLIDELTQIAEGFFSSVEIKKKSTQALNQIVKDFYELYRNRKLIDNTHGSGFHNAFWLYLFSRVLNPDLIIESGVWKAHTTWLLEQACPEAAIFGFDRNLQFVEYNDLKATLIESDWGTYQFPQFNPDKSFVFFDCHVNNAQRILEAKEKGFKHLLFDDNPPVHKIFSHIPGIPTAAMLDSGLGIDQPEIKWIWNGEEVTRSIDIEQARKAKELIKVHRLFPDTGGPTRYGGFGFLTYVQI